MEFKGEFEVNAERHVVSSFISNIDRVISIIPDVLSSEKTGENSSRLVVKAGISGIKGKFNLQLEIKDRKGDESVEIAARGSGTTGSMDLKASYRFSDSVNGSTVVSWVLNLTIGGMVATMGSRVLNSAADKYIKLLTDSFKHALSNGYR